MPNLCPLVSPERVNELLSHIPPREAGKAWGNDEQRTAAQVIAALLRECGIYGTDVYSIGQNLSKTALPAL